MNDAILILNAGSSSLKFSVFRDCEPTQLLLRGELQALKTEPKFVARDACEKVVDGVASGCDFATSSCGRVPT
jgi:acetate kinase